MKAMNSSSSKTSDEAKRKRSSALSPSAPARALAVQRLESLWRVLTWLRVAIGVCIVAVAIATFSQSSGNPQRPVTTVAAVDERSPQHEFLDWFRAAGGVASGVSIGVFDGMGRGVIATQDIHEDDLLLRVPLDIIMCQATIEQVLPASLKAPFEQLRHASDEYLTAFLVLEQRKGTASAWAPYLAILPQRSAQAERNAMTPLFFEADSDLELLDDDRMREAARQERHRATLAFKRFKELFRDHGGVTWRAYRWARFLINSRAFSLRGDRMLVPFGDLFNGQAQSRQREQSNGQAFLKYHRLTATAMEISADRATSVGRQVFEDYGDNDNYIYALYHGFLLSPNAFDCAALRLPALEQSKASRQHEILERARVDDGPVVCVSSDGRLQSRYDAQVLRFYQRLVAMGNSPDEDANEMLERCAKPHNFNECFLRDPDENDERGERAMLLRALRARNASYATSLEHDRRLLQDSASLTSSQRHAVRFRVSRKEIVSSALRVLTIATSEEPSPDMADGNADAVDPVEQDVASVEEESDDGRVARFLEWIEAQRFPVKHVALRFISPAMGFGVVATKDLALGELYLSVPVDAVINVDAAQRSESFRRLLLAPMGRQLRDDLVLALFLLHEAVGPAAASSRWKPYLDLLPTAERLGSPLLWARDAVELRQLRDATDLSRLVDAYRSRIDDEFTWLQRHVPSQVTTWLTREHYRWATAILDSRSIWWGGQRHLVPLLDMVNCLEREDPASGHASARRHMPHHTTLSASGDTAETRASWPFQAGEQVVENYGQPNYIYLLYHGFVLARNSHDCAHLQFSIAASSEPAERQELIAMMERLQLFSWTPDVCVAPGKKEDLLLRVALLASSPQRALELQRQRPGGITAEHVRAALVAVKARRDRLQSVSLADDVQSSAGAFIRQQETLMQALERRLEERLTGLGI
ncbi:hypothetical protein ATCC90586_007025 [Pythium insidiosum]|nr:hypothetical protein ATCC90586_007025 [Pythium insidiosum]